MKQPRFYFQRLLRVALAAGLVLPLRGALAFGQQKQPAGPTPAPEKPSISASAASKPLQTPPASPGAAPIELRMKFKPNDLSRYQMTMQADMLLPGIAQGAASQYNSRLNMVIQQKVIKVRPDGSADVAITTLSGEGIVNRQPFKPDTSGKPSIITFDTHNNIVAAKDLPKSSTGIDPTSKIFQSGALSTQGVYLPKQPVRIGDKWTQKINVAGLGKGSVGTVQTKLVRIEPVGTFNTARLHSTMSVPFVLNDASVKPPVAMKGLMTMNYDSNLALLEGKVIRSTGDGEITVTVNMPGNTSPKTGKSKTGKSVASKTPTPPAAQKVSVKLRMGNNLMTQ